MSGLDALLSASLKDIVIDNLGESTIKKIEDRLFEKFGISLVQSIKEFEKIDVVLREFFGKGADGIEKKCLEQVLAPKSKTSTWYKIKTPDISSTILEAFGDDDKKKIINATYEEPLIISEILKKCNLPQTSGYRKINNLIDNGLLYNIGYIVRDNKKINQYLCIFQNLKININKDKIQVDIQLSEYEQNHSQVLQIVKT